MFADFAGDHNNLTDVGAAAADDDDDDDQSTHAEATCRQHSVVSSCPVVVGAGTGNNALPERAQWSSDVEVAQTFMLRCGRQGDQWCHGVFGYFTSQMLSPRVVLWRRGRGGEGDGSGGVGAPGGEAGGEFIDSRHTTTSYNRLVGSGRVRSGQVGSAAAVAVVCLLAAICYHRTYRSWLLEANAFFDNSSFLPAIIIIIFFFFFFFPALWRSLAR